MPDNHGPTPPTVETPGQPGDHSFLTWLLVVAFVYLLLVGVSTIGAGFKWASGGAEGAERIFAFATNPVVGVILGTLSTALVKSSSTVTSVIVGLVAGGVPVSIAVPIIMGANMGTTITNTIVALGDVKDGKTFNKAFRASTVHDFFNLYSIVIFLPIEVIFQPLERMGGALSKLLVGEFNASMKGVNFIGELTKPPADWIEQLLHGMSDTLGGILMAAMGIGFIFMSVTRLGKLLGSVMRGPAKQIVDKSFAAGPIVGILAGTIITVLVQSSSTTTSLIIPLAAAGVLSLRQVYPFTLGANIGTCITAVLAATAVSGIGAGVAMQIALVHLLYNVFGVIVFAVVPLLYDLPVRSAEWLGNKTEKHRGWAFGYIGFVFFLVPASVLGIQTRFGSESTPLDPPDFDPAAKIEAGEEMEKSGALIE